MEEQDKWLKSLGYGVHYVSSGSTFFLTTSITFTEQDPSSVHLPHDDLLIIKLRIKDCIVSKVLVDGGSSAAKLFLEAFDKIRLNINDIKPSMQLLVAFNSERVMPIGMIKLKVHAVERIIDVNFLVVDCHLSLQSWVRHRSIRCRQ